MTCDKIALAKIIEPINALEIGLDFQSVSIQIIIIIALHICEM